MDDDVLALSSAQTPDRRVSQTNNFLLQNLSAQDFALLQPHLEPVRIGVGEVIARTGDPIESISFFEGAVAGILDSLDEEHRFAIGLVGQEGFVGWPLLLGSRLWPHDVVMRAEEAEAWRLPAPALLQAVSTSASLQATLLRFTNVFMIQMSRTIVSSLAHTVERRMARWILLYHDRVQTDEIAMTHEEFRLMLGVRRSSVTDALRHLMDERAVLTTRGKIIVLDRSKLVELSGATYGSAESEYRRLIINRPD